MRNLLPTVAILSMNLIGAAAIGAQPVPSPPDHKVIELRQYKLTPGSQARFIALFDSEFVEPQEAAGMRLIGQFHDHDRPDRFTWIREFPSMAKRPEMLGDFYFGPVWHEYRDVANPMLWDNDNVLLLREARQGSGFGPSAPRPTGHEHSTDSNTIFAVIEYLWKEPDEGFENFFIDHMAPMLNQAGLPVLGVYVPEEQPNNFPRLPIRPDRHLLVWFTKAAHPDDFEMIEKRLRASSEWTETVAPTLAISEERAPTVLRLDPNPRSALR